MTHFIQTRIGAVLFILLATTALPKAEEAEPVTQLKAEKAALEKRLTEINAQIDQVWVGRGVEFLGMMLVDPTKELAKQYRQPADDPKPIVVKIQNGSFFLDGTEPGEGCAFWIVEHPANGFLLRKDKRPSFYPKTVRELIAAIVACTITPEEYRKLWDETTQAARDRAETLPNRPAERERMLKIADSKVPEEYAAKYICRVVYNYPDQKGTMTTQFQMDKADLDRLRELLAK